MTSDQSLDNFVVNPKTGRLVKRNSRTHKRLVASKLLDEPISTPEQNLILKVEDKEHAKELQSKMNKSMQKNKVITRRGNKVLKANRRPTRVETIDKVSDFAIETVLENKNEILEQDMTDAECENYIKNLIRLKLAGHNTKPPPPSPVSSASPKVIPTRRPLFELDD